MYDNHNKKDFLKEICLKIICFYRNYISPVFPPSCRFHPTCSQYGLIALERFGSKKGLALLFRRLSRCHPFHLDKTMIVDPVPETWNQ